MNQTHTHRPWNPWPISIIAFFTVAIIGCGTFIVFCSRHPADLVAADYYEQEVRYQGQIDRVQHAQQAAAASIGYDATTKLISIALPPNHSQHKSSGSIQLYRPSAASLDRTVKLSLNKEGVQEIPAREMPAGLWKVRVMWRNSEADFFTETSVVIPVKS